MDASLRRGGVNAKVEFVKVDEGWAVKDQSVTVSGLVKLLVREVRWIVADG